jgi:hypothetical protein
MVYPMWGFLRRHVRQCQTGISHHNLNFFIFVIGRVYVDLISCLVLFSSI